MFRHDLGVHVSNEHVQSPFTFLWEDGRVESCLLAINDCHPPRIGYDRPSTQKRREKVIGQNKLLTIWRLVKISRSLSADIWTYVWLAGTLESRALWGRWEETEATDRKVAPTLPNKCGTDTRPLRVNTWPKRRYLKQNELRMKPDKKIDPIWCCIRVNWDLMQLGEKAAISSGVPSRKTMLTISLPMCLFLSNWK